MKKKFLIAMVLIMALLAAGCAPEVAAEEPKMMEEPEATAEPVETEEPAETEEEMEIVYLDDFVYEDAQGNEVRLSDYAGKMVIIDYWATSCGYCIKEMPDLVRLDEEYDEVVVISASIGDTAKSLQKFIDNQAEEGVSYEHDLVLDVNNSAWGFNISGTPVKIYVGPNLEYVYKITGATDYEGNKDLIDQMLGAIEDAGIELY